MVENNHITYSENISKVIQNYYKHFKNRGIDEESDLKQDDIEDFNIPSLIENNIDDIHKTTDGIDELPLLEELEIYPERIFKQTIEILNPADLLTKQAVRFTKESDLIGPILFCLFLASALLLSGKHAHFSFVYSFSMVSCTMMFLLINLMTPSNVYVNFRVVASVLGYCSVPVVFLSFTGILFKLKNFFGLASAVFSVVWSSLTASRMFVILMGDKDQRLLVAYPCLLAYSVITLLIIF